MIRKQNIAYVNFTQYDNVGRILDFLRENFSVVIHFSYDHLRLKHGKNSSYLRIYEKGKLVEEKKLINFRFPGFLLYPSLPLVALLIALQTFVYVFRLKKKYQSLHVFLSINAFAAWMGNILRDLKLIKKTIYWVGDYFPPAHQDWKLATARKIYLTFDKASIKRSDKLIFFNQRIPELLKARGVIPKNNSYEIIPLGCKIIKRNNDGKNCIIGFLGMIKENQGAEFIFDVFPKLKKQFPSIKLEIIGSGPDEDFYRQKAKKMSNSIKFYGFIEDQDDIHKIISRWSIGLAPYKPDKNNPAYFADWSKIKFYLSTGVPVITTDVAHTADQINKHKAGIIIDYYDYESTIIAVGKILKNNSFYRRNAYALAKKYNYKKIYPKLFSPSR